MYRTGADGKKKAGFSHVFPGGNDPAFVAKAIKTECSIRNRELIVRVENRSAHRFPGEVPTRIFMIRTQFWDGDGTMISEEVLSYRRPGKGEVGWKDNRFEPDEVKSIVRTVPDKTAKVKTDFLFMNGPFAVFDKAFTIAAGNRPKSRPPTSLRFEKDRSSLPSPGPRGGRPSGRPRAREDDVGRRMTLVFTIRHHRCVIAAPSAVEMP